MDAKLLIHCLATDPQARCPCSRVVADSVEGSEGRYLSRCGICCTPGTWVSEI
ncbi:hypothetical protein P175DRAFT_0498565 [Aspergillus ochraceoroseus IBT 24754]|uniref:Uncharacterized protein n=1 Tax=Aspergillus ochraceoroseus IBT 24754 TaxID=1392256 RepID=A0A2T5MA91_9EURO|nr:uncharacterized protein P175DRAFT_0498565 [Aspergillus ochraceoroseus IBT 24754]PTU25462.1 hypothetical protein P175DRAFT_0498565 [Aspergillus ochraceoroseus IBT 24754]